MIETEKIRRQEARAAEAKKGPSRAVEQASQKKSEKKRKANDGVRKISNREKRKLRVGSWNVCGFARSERKRLEIVDQVEQSDLDVVGIQETWELKDGDVVSKLGKYRWVGKARKGLDPKKRGEGGVGFLVKEHLFDVVEVVVKTEFEETLWLKIPGERSEKGSTDHFLIWANIDRSRKIKSKKQRKVFRWKVERLGDDGTRDEFQKGLAGSVESFRKLLRSVEDGQVDVQAAGDRVIEGWESIVNATAERVVGTKVVRCGVSVKWWDDELKEEIGERREVFNKYLSEASEESWEKYRAKRKQVKGLVRKKKKCIWDEVVQKANGGLEGNVKQMWEGISGMTVELEKEFTEDEVEACVNKLKCHKAAGADGIVNEFMKFGGKGMIQLMVLLYNWVWKNEYTPSRWREGVVVNLFKKGDKTDPGNYRGITLLNTVGKCSAETLFRIVGISEKEHSISEGQAGFRRKRGCVDHVFTVGRIIQGRKRAGKPTYCFFLDVKKAYDTVWRNGLWKQLSKYGIKGKMWRVLKKMTECTKSAVMLDGELSKFFDIEQGVPQGCTLSPTLFQVFINDLLEVVEAVRKGVKVGDTETSVTGMLFADDFVGMSDTPEGLQLQIDAAKKFTDKWRLSAHVHAADVQFLRSQSSSYPHHFFGQIGVDVLVIDPVFAFMFIWYTGLIEGRSVQGEILPTIVHHYPTLVLWLVVIGVGWAPVQIYLFNRYPVQ
ncbi:unnamed protein product [Ectocarpus sp. CCAP 1310/34]|nr:unnamed protein product [Ectocarpus sp. CCAP 1310/34]